MRPSATAGTNGRPPLSMAEVARLWRSEGWRDLDPEDFDQFCDSTQKLFADFLAGVANDGVTADDQRAAVEAIGKEFNIAATPQRRRATPSREPTTGRHRAEAIDWSDQLSTRLTAAKSRLFTAAQTAVNHIPDTAAVTAVTGVMAAAVAGGVGNAPSSSIPTAGDHRAPAATGNAAHGSPRATVTYDKWGIPSTIDLTGRTKALGVQTDILAEPTFAYSVTPKDWIPQRSIAAIDQFGLEDSKNGPFRQRKIDGRWVTYCNRAWSDYSGAMGAPIPHYINKHTGEPAPWGSNGPDYKELTANETADWMAQHAQTAGYVRVTEADAQRLANAGIPTVALWKNPNPDDPGHVMIVRPGTLTDRGPEIAQAGAKNFNDTHVGHIFPHDRSGIVYYSAVKLYDVAHPHAQLHPTVTSPQLIAIDPRLEKHAATVAKLLPALNQAMWDGGINTPDRIAAFLSKIAAENGFAALSQPDDFESFMQQHGAAQAKYYRRGFFPLAGEGLYAQLGEALHLDLVNHPELAEQPKIAARIAVYLWNLQNLSRVADHPTPHALETIFESRLGASIEDPTPSKAQGARKFWSAAKTAFSHGHLFPGASAYDAKAEGPVPTPTAKPAPTPTPSPAPTAPGNSTHQTVDGVSVTVPHGFRAAMGLTHGPTYGPQTGPLSPHTVTAWEIIRTLGFKGDMGGWGDARHLKESWSLHNVGRAIDMSTHNLEVGNELRDFFIANADKLGVIEVIWNKQIYTKNSNWKPDAYHGDSDHTDHVHVGFSGPDMKRGQGVSPKPIIQAHPSDVTLNQLYAVFPRLKEPEHQAWAKSILPALNEAMYRGGITTKERQAAFLAQLGWESGQLVSMHEIGNAGYFNHQYANILGNGNEASGDGYRFRGAGFIQLTGRGNYRHYGHLIGLGDQLEQNPDLAARPDVAAKIAVAFWNSHHLNDLADQITRYKFELITHKIQGGSVDDLERGMHGERQREHYWEHFLKLFGVHRNDVEGAA